MLGSQGRHQEQCYACIYDFPENPFFRYQTAVQAEGKGQQHYANHGQSVPVQPRKALIETAYHQAQQIFDMQKMGVRRAGNDARRHIPHGHIIVDVIDKGNGFVYKVSKHAASIAPKTRHPLFISPFVLMSICFTPVSDKNSTFFRLSHDLR